MPTALRKFFTSEEAAVTVDWVVLTAGIVGLLFLLVYTPVRTAVRGLAEGIGTELGLIEGEIFGEGDTGDISG